jgi:hypothetical protein
MPTTELRKRPDPLCVVCLKPIPTGTPHYQRGLAVHIECEEKRRSGSQR